MINNESSQCIKVSISESESLTKKKTMNQNNLLNPYKLLGVNYNSTISELKKNYYNLSLLTHPDKGGSDSDFNTVHLAYNYIKEQLLNINDSTYEELEEAFEIFCKKQTERKPPCFYEVYKETNDWLNEFNKQFELNKINENTEEKSNIKTNNPFDIGYGEFMDSRENNLDEDYNPELTQKEPKLKFQTEIIEYKEPKYLPDSIVNFPLKINKINDFTELSGNLKMSDYKKTFQNPIEKKNVIEIDYPKQNIKYNPTI